jgi:hypothetical protein
MAPDALHRGGVSLLPDPVIQPQNGSQPASNNGAGEQDQQPENGRQNKPLTIGDVIKRNKLEKEYWNDTVSRTYWMRGGKYFYHHESGRWGEYQREDYLTVLNGTAFFGHIIEESAQATKNKRSAYFAKLQRHLFENNTIDFVGSAAGYGHRGCFKAWKGKKFLFTDGPKLIEPVKGDSSTIRGLLLQALGKEQFEHYVAWLKTGYVALREGNTNTGQILVLAGPPGVGKSLIKEFINRPVLGGRHGDPTPYLQGDTRFNSDLMGAEVWEIDDCIGISDSQRRKTYATAFKKMAASSDHRVEGKGTNAIQPPPMFNRTIVCTNDEEADLWILPEQSNSLVDKMICLMVSKPEQPAVKLPTIPERSEFREKIAEELPGFIYWMLYEWEIPTEIQDDRYGVRAYQHPELKAKTDSMSDHARVRDMIDMLIFEFGKEQEWKGSVSQLELDLRRWAKEANMIGELHKVLWHRQTLRHALGKLKGPGSRFQPWRTNSERGWTIQHPSWQPELVAVK